MTENSPEEALYKDLINDWQDQKQVLKEQIGLINPMANSLRKNSAQRFLNASLNILMEILMYGLSILCIAYIFFMNNIGPFFVMGKIGGDKEIVPTRITETEMQNFDFAIKGLFILAAALLLIIGRMLANIRHKNAALNLAGKNMKIIAGQCLNRKTTIDTLEQKHIMVLPATDIIVDNVVVNDPNNPAHEDPLL